MNTIQLSQMPLWYFTHYLSAGELDGEVEEARMIQAHLMVRHDQIKAAKPAITPADLAKALIRDIAAPHKIDKKVRGALGRWNRKEKSTELDKQIKAAKEHLDHSIDPGTKYEAVPAMDEIMLKMKHIDVDIRNTFLLAQLALRMQALLDAQGYNLIHYPHVLEPVGTTPEVAAAIRAFNMINIAYQRGKLFSRNPLDKIDFGTPAAPFVRTMKELRVGARGDRDRSWVKAVSDLSGAGFTGAVDGLDMAGFALNMVPIDNKGAWADLLAMKDDPKLYYEKLQELRKEFFTKIRDILTGTDEVKAQSIERYVELLGFGGARRSELIEIFKGTPGDNLDEFAWKLFDAERKVSIYRYKLRHTLDDAVLRSDPTKQRPTPELAVHHGHVTQAMGQRGVAEMHTLLHRPGPPPVERRRRFPAAAAA